MTARTDLRSRAAEKLPPVTAHARVVIRVIARILVWFMTGVAGLLMFFSRVLEQFLKQAGTSGVVQSVMTDRNGTAFFTDLTPGTYVLSNLVPTEYGQTLVTWNCEVQFKADDVATEKPYQISNRKDRTTKCVGIVKPMPACTTN